MAGESSVRCDRARQWASLRVDGELSEVESRLLDRHLATCPACREWEARVDHAAGLLRAASQEKPSRPVELPRRPRLPARRRVAVAAVAAAVAAAAALGAMLSGSASSGPSPARVPAPELGFLPRDLEELRQLPRNEQVTPPDRPERPSIPPEDAV